MFPKSLKAKLFALFVFIQMCVFVRFCLRVVFLHENNSEDIGTSLSEKMWRASAHLLSCSLLCLFKGGSGADPAHKHSSPPPTRFCRHSPETRSFHSSFATHLDTFTVVSYAPHTIENIQHTIKTKIMKKFFFPNARMTIVSKKMCSFIITFQKTEGMQKRTLAAGCPC